ncbi:hypothetical protein [Cerasicoccus frondis]|uniref:hypothetical protein n=1 Tax=Cerasicoccus frondis TaxID=490090 RepID=UPI0028526C08|nr:hypothetical protein [Cerasicoccus frondis]
MKRLLIRCFGMLAPALITTLTFIPFGVQANSDILTPAAYGNVTSSYFGGSAFDAQPTWSGVVPTGGDAGYNAFTVTWEGANKISYIDLGADWADWRIEQTWTKYIQFRSGSGAAYSQLWWDDDIDAVNDGINETTLNFNTQAHDSTGQWMQDVDATAAPVIPQNRYLMLKGPASPGNEPSEIAMVGYKYTIPPTDILTPLGYGNVTSSNFGGRALENPPTWNGTAPVGGDVGYNAFVVTWEGANKVSYIDLGPDWSNWRIQETWTKYIQYRTGSGAAYDQLWWDDDIDAVNDGVTEDTLNFNTNAHDGSGQWMRDVDANSAPVIPQGRYLLLKGPTSPGNEPNEIAFVGYQTTGGGGGGNGGGGSNTGLPTLTMDEVTAFDLSQLTLVDEVICGDPNDPHPVIESSAGVSQIETILDRSCRVLPNVSGGIPSYFAYRLGENSLEAGKAYILVLEYPEDQPRNLIVMNRGCETTRTFHTGTTVGDALYPQYEQSNSNSMRYGISLEYRTAEQLFHLHDRYPGILQPRDAEYPRDNFPEDGFLLMIGQYAYEDCPKSAGAAVARIALYEAPALESYTQQVQLPVGLPKRHLFWREEMSDSCINNTPAGVTDDIDFYEYKARLMKFLGMNTFCKDLMEFGHNQGFDSSKYASWYVKPSFDNRWEQILHRLTDGGYGLDVMPYYEYAGGTAGLGAEKRAETLSGGNTYVNIPWCENFNVDITDPDTYTDFARVLECTIDDIKDGNRPTPVDPTFTWIYNSSANQWGYIDFGANWQNVRITQTWTRSTPYRAGPASPYQALYWHSSPTGFSGSTVPAGAIQEGELNFITNSQNGSGSVWTRDINLAPQDAITPQQRYLAVRAASPLTEAQEGLIVGWIEDGGTPVIQTIPVTAGSINGHNLGNFFDNQAPFNTHATEFAGVWLRPRPSHMPISFSDATRARFASEANGGVAVSRMDLESNSTLLESYYAWWMDKRKAFLQYFANHLRTNVNQDAVVLLTRDYLEAGARLSTHPRVVTDDPDAWVGLVNSSMSYTDALANQIHKTALLSRQGYYGWEEWIHSVPWADPENYLNNDGVLQTYTFNQPYTVSDLDAWYSFEMGTGLAAIRHYCLNEQSFLVNNDSIVGYYVSDVNYAGPYSMIGEARAVAFGDPYYIGYLASNNYNRWFPGYVRDFNANYLALPALPSDVEEGAASDAEVVVRSISTSNQGTWVAIINTGILEKEQVTIDLPVAGTVTDAVTGDPVPVVNGAITLDMWPARLKSIHIEP